MAEIVCLPWFTAVNYIVFSINNRIGTEAMSAIRNGASQGVSGSSPLRRDAAGPAEKSPGSFSRGIREAGHFQGRSSGPKAVAAALVSRCSDRLEGLHATGVRNSDFLGRDGDALVFCNRERAEVCIQTGTDVCTVKSDGRVFLNGDPLERGQPGFLGMVRRLADLGEKVAADGLQIDGEIGSAASKPPWNPESAMHANYVL